MLQPAHCAGLGFELVFLPNLLVDGRLFDVFAYHLLVMRPKLLKTPLVLTR